MNPPLPRCIDCGHICTKHYTTYVCKLNAVAREVTDTCCWSGKQYPSKFEARESIHDNQRELIKSMEVLEAMTIKGDTNTWLHISRVADLARGGYFHMRKK